MTSGIEGREEEVWALLRRRVALCTGLDHSSVTAEKAQRLLDSLLYTLALGDAVLSETPALAAGSVPLEEVFRLGRRRIDSQRKVSKTLWRRVGDTLLPTDQLCYRETLLDGMAAFFRRYEPEFSAPDHIITCDYPLAVPPEGLEGVTLIQTYLERALWENRFCAHFPAPALRALWRRQGMDRDSFCNLFLPVLTTALVCVLLREDPANLSPTHGGVVRLQAALLPRDLGQVEAMLREALTVLNDGLVLRGRPLIGYLEQALPAVAADLWRAKEGLNLAALLGCQT